MKVVTLVSFLSDLVAIFCCPKVGMKVAIDIFKPTNSIFLRIFKKKVAICPLCGHFRVVKVASKMCKKGPKIGKKGVKIGKKGCFSVYFE